MTETTTTEGPQRLQRPVDWDVVRRWTTSGAVVLGAASMIYSAWLLTGVAREVRYGPDLAEVTEGIERVEAQVRRSAAAAPPVRAASVDAFGSDADDVVRAIQAQTYALQAEERRTQQILTYR